MHLGHLLKFIPSTIVPPAGNILYADDAALLKATFYIAMPKRCQMAQYGFYEKGLSFQETICNLLSIVLETNVLQQNILLCIFIESSVIEVAGLRSLLPWYSPLCFCPSAATFVAKTHKIYAKTDTK